MEREKVLIPGPSPRWRGEVTIMKAITFHGKQQVRYESIPDPGLLEPTDVIVKLCFICGSDLHVYDNREKGLDHGTARGHEFTGEIVEKGISVKSLQIGDLVIAMRAPKFPFINSFRLCERSLEIVTTALFEANGENNVRGKISKRAEC